METWPNFFIVGQPKAGTTSLWAYLNEIPGIYMSPVKEPNYFNRNKFPTDLKNPRQIRDKKKYLDLFKGVKDEKILGEASPGYLEDPEVPRLIYEVSPNSHILISLRDPIERAFSLYLMNVRNGEVNLPFHEIVKERKNIGNNFHNRFLPERNYAEKIKRYIDIFGKQKVKVIIFEEFVKESEKHVKEIVEFLGLIPKNIVFNKKIYNEFGISRGKIATKMLVSKKLKHYAKQYLSSSTRNFLKKTLLIKKMAKPKMEEEDRLILQNYHSNDVTELKKLLGRELPWKNFQD